MTEMKLNKKSTLEGRKWNGFLIISGMLYSWGSALIVYGWIYNAMAAIAGILIFIGGGLIGAFGTLVTGTVVQDGNITKQYIPELAGKTDQPEKKT